MSLPSVQHPTDHPSNFVTLEENAARGTEVFVGGLSRSISEEKLHKEIIYGQSFVSKSEHDVFSACGEILEIRMMKDKNGNLKGFCFVRFATKESAARAVREKSGTVLDGKKIGVLPSSEQDTLYLGNLNKAWTANEFERIVRQVFPDIESIDLPMLKDTPPGQKQRNRGFAFVKFSSHAAAARAHRMGIQPEFRLGNLHPAVQWAEEETATDPNELAKIKVAFVRNLPIDAEENYLKQLFEPFGQVEKVVVSRRGSCPVGFVHFTERLHLERAIKELNEKTVQGPSGVVMCKLQVEVARPVDKNKKRVRENSESTFVQDHSKLSKPNNHTSLLHRVYSSQEMESDPYEAAVIELPLAVKERLLRILRLGIATRFDIDVKSLCSLKELPVSNAISVLDQFMISGASLQNKGAYLNGLISRHLVDKMGSNQSLNSLSRVADSSRNESRLFNIPHQVSSHTAAPFASYANLSAARPDIYATKYSSSHSDYPLSSPPLIRRADEQGLSDYHSRSSRTRIGRVDERCFPDYPLSSRAVTGRVNESGLPESHLPNISLSGSHTFQIPRIQTMEEISLSPYEPTSVPSVSFGRVGLRIEEKHPSPVRTAPSPSILYGRPGANLNSGPSHGTVVAAGHQESRPQIRFDPFTGEPYKFDPFTGEPIHPVNTSACGF
ncbi:hypothetical protein OROGR_007757 [Orobanche gracilis]